MKTALQNLALSFMLTAGISALAPTWLDATAVLAAEPDVQVSLSPRSGGINDTFIIDISVITDDGVPLTRPSFDPGPVFQVVAIIPSNDHVLINGFTRLVVSFQYQLRAVPGTFEGVYPLPPGRITVANQTYEFDPGSISIGAFREPGQRRSALDFTQIVSDLEPYVGEQVLYRAEIVTTTEMRNGRVDDLQSQGFSKETFGKQQEQQRMVGPNRARIFSIREALFPLKQGTVVIPERTLTAEIPVHTTGSARGSIFDMFINELPGINEFDLEERVFRAKPITIQVKPLPPLPAGIKSAAIVPVGKISLDSSVDRNEVPVGESLSYIVKLTGDGNLRSVELSEPTGPDTSRFRVYSEKPVVTAEPHGDRITMTKTFTLTLVPLEAGSFDLPQYEFTTFSPSLKEYRQLRTPLRTITVSGPAGAPHSSASNSGSATTAASSPTLRDELPKLDGDTSGLRPAHFGPAALQMPAELAAHTRWTLLFGLPLLAILVRLFLSRRQARLTRDPSTAVSGRALRRAQDRLRALHKQDNARELHNVLTDYVADRMSSTGRAYTSAELLGLIRASMPESAERTRLEAVVAQLDRLSYGGSGEASQQVSEASTELAALLPKLDRSLAKASAAKPVVLAALLLLTPAIVRAELTIPDILRQAEHEYSSGDYETALKAYLLAIELGAENADTLYNAANCFLKKGNVGLAIAFYRQALAENPADPDIRFNLELARTKVNGAPSIASEEQPLAVLRRHVGRRALRQYFVFGVAAASLLFAVTPVFPALLAPLTWIAFAVAAILGFSVYGIDDDRRGEPQIALTSAAWDQAIDAAVVVAKEAKIYTRPSEDSGAVLVAPEGLELLVGVGASGWNEVILPDNRRGWTKAGQLKRL